MKDPTSRRSALLSILALHAFAADRPRLFVYAPLFSDAHAWLPVSCGGAVVAELQRGTFFVLSLEPGRYTLQAKGGAPVVIELRPGGDHFLRVESKVQTGGKSIPLLRAVSPEQAREQLDPLAYIRSDKIRSRAVLAADPRPAPVPQFKTRPPR